MPKTQTLQETIATKITNFSFEKLQQALIALHQIEIGEETIAQKVVQLAQEKEEAFAKWEFQSLRCDQLKAELLNQEEQSKIIFRDLKAQEEKKTRRLLYLKNKIVALKGKLIVEKEELDRCKRRKEELEEVVSRLQKK